MDGKCVGIGRTSSITLVILFYFLYIEYMWWYPSIMAHVTQGLILLFTILYGIRVFPKLQSLEPYKILGLLLLFAIAIGIHSISHLGLEKEYHYMTPLHARNSHTAKKEKTSEGMNCPCMASSGNYVKTCPFMKTA